MRKKRSRRPIQAPIAVFPPNKSAGLSARSCVTSQVHELFLRAIFAPAGHRPNVSTFSQAPSASRSRHRLPSFLLMKYGSSGCNAKGGANTNNHRSTNTRSFFFAPAAILNEFEQRFDSAQAQIHPHPEPNSSPPSPGPYSLDIENKNRNSLRDVGP